MKKIAIFVISLALLSCSDSSTNASKNAAHNEQKPAGDISKTIKNTAQDEIKVAASSSSPSEEEMKKQAEEKKKEEARANAEDVTPTKDDLKLSIKDFLNKYPESKGKLQNPYSSKDEKLVEEGRKIYLGYSCNGCHGGTGGGGMCPPLTNDIWVYGDDYDTLFRLIALGTDGLKRPRKRSETVKGPMPPFQDLFDTSDELWKVLAFVRAVYEKRHGK